MTTSKVTRAALAGIAALTLVGVPAASAAPAPLASAAAGPTQQSPTGIPPTSPTAYLFGETLAKLQGGRLETTFMAEIIPHHRAAIEMAKLELARGKDPDIRTHAENIISSQQNQIAQFTRWLEEWYGLTPEQAMKQAPEEARLEMAKLEKETQQRMAELKKVPAGAQFDVAFVRMMAAHHQAGIIEFLEPQTRAVHAQLRVAAATGITTQEAEVADFVTWLSARR